MSKMNELYDNHRHGSKSLPFKDVQDSLFSLLRKVGETWIIIDGLDEISNDTMISKFAPAFFKQVLDPRQGKNHLLTYSRSKLSVPKSLGSIIRADAHLLVEGNGVKQDIESHVNDRLSDEEFDKWRNEPERISRMERANLKDVRTMFRLAACRLDVVQNCSTSRELELELSYLPSDFNKVYDRIWNVIPAGIKRDNAVRILQLLLWSARPLTFLELSDAIVVDTDSTPAFKPADRMPRPSELEGFCPGLAVIKSLLVSTPSNDLKDVALASVMQELEAWVFLTRRAE